MPMMILTVTLRYRTISPYSHCSLCSLFSNYSIGPGVGLRQSSAVVLAALILTIRAVVLD